MSLMVAPSRTGNLASVEEIRRALANLSVADRIRLKKIAQARALGLGSTEWGDLLNEAAARMLRGSRRWPKDVQLVAFIAETMRSVASEWREHGKLLPAARDDAATTGGEAIVEQPDPERTAIALNLLKHVRAAFEKDVAVLDLIDGLMEGETARETMGRTGLSPYEFDAARKRFRRGVGKIVEERGGA